MIKSHFISLVFIAILFGQENSVNLGSRKTFFQGQISLSAPNGTGERRSMALGIGGGGWLDDRFRIMIDAHLRFHDEAFEIDCIQSGDVYTGTVFLTSYGGVQVQYSAIIQRMSEVYLCFGMGMQVHMSDIRLLDSEGFETEDDRVHVQAFNWSLAGQIDLNLTDSFTTGIRLGVH